MKHAKQFGEVRDSEVGDWLMQERGFTGHMENRGGIGSNFTPDVGLTYMNARYYVPGINQFLTADTIVANPVNAQNYNRYSYVLNNPIALVDPSGHFSQGAIEEYVSGTCDGDQSCIDETLAAWQADESWWNMLLEAEAGDTLLVGIDGSFSRSDHGNSGYSGFVNGSAELGFTGSGRDVLTGIEFVLRNDTDRFLFPAHRIGLNHVFQGSYIDGYDRYSDRYESEWDAISISITWGGLLRGGILQRQNNRTRSFYINMNHHSMTDTRVENVSSGLGGLGAEEAAGLVAPALGLAVDLGLTIKSIVNDTNFSPGDFLSKSHEYYLQIPGGEFHFIVYQTYSAKSPEGVSILGQIGGYK